MDNMHQADSSSEHSLHQVRFPLNFAYAQNENDIDSESSHQSGNHFNPLNHQHDFGANPFGNRVLILHHHGGNNAVL